MTKGTGEIASQLQNVNKICIIILAFISPNTVHVCLHVYRRYMPNFNAPCAKRYRRLDLGGNEEGGERGWVVVCSGCKFGAKELAHRRPRSSTPMHRLRQFGRAGAGVTCCTVRATVVCSFLQNIYSQNIFHICATDGLGIEMTSAKFQIKQHGPSTFAVHTLQVPLEQHVVA